MFDIAIIGAGPGGLTAGIYARRAGYTVALFEMGVPGGQAATTDLVENFPGYPKGVSGSELMMSFYEHAVSFGADIIFERVVAVDLAGKIKTVTTANQEGEKHYEARVVVFATGAQPRLLGVPGEGVYRGKGVSYCATCDGFFFKDKDVCVVGGGDVAVDEALYLTRMCKSVTIFHRRDELRANKRSQEMALSNEKVTVVWDTIVKRLSGEEKLDTVETENVKTGEIKTWTFDGCFVFIGYMPNDEVIPESVNRDEKGCVITDDALSTNMAGVYAIGDVRTKRVRQIGTAVGDATIVMYDVERYLREEEKHE